MNTGECYLKDPETGQFQGSRSGCGGEKSRVSERTWAEIEKSKYDIYHWANRRASLEHNPRSASAVKDKAVLLADKVSQGEMSVVDGLKALSRDGRAADYLKAAEILNNDAPYWSDIAGKAGTDMVDSIMTNYTSSPVAGVTDFFDHLWRVGVKAHEEAMKNKPEEPKIRTLASAEAGAEKEKTQPRRTPEQYERDKAKVIQERKSQKPIQKAFEEKKAQAGPVSKEEVDRRNEAVKQWETKNPDRRSDGRENPNLIKCEGNVCRGKASMYDTKRFKGEPTSRMETYQPDQYTAAMHLADPLPRAYSPLKDYSIAKVTYTNKEGVTRSIYVPVNDHGPYFSTDEKPKPPHSERVVDLSEKAYQALTGDKKGGVVDVTVEWY